MLLNRAARTAADVSRRGDDDDEENCYGKTVCEAFMINAHFVIQHRKLGSSTRKADGLT